jgi:integrase
VSKRSLWPSVKAKKAKGRTYWYWTRVEPGASWVRLPDPYTDADAFMRKIAHLQRVAVKLQDRTRQGTFGGLVAAYRASPKFRDMKPRSQVSYDRYLDRLLLAYADAPLTELTPEDIQVRVMDGNADTPAAADQMLSILRTLYKFAAKRQRGLEDWTAGIEQYSNHSEREPWPANVLADALASADPLFRLAVALHLYTGQRTGDACVMTWGAAAAGSIAVKQEKTGTPLEIPLHPTLAAELARAERRGVVILTNRRGGALTPGTFLKWCWAFSKGYGLKLSPHGLRKNATNELFEAGCSTAEVASITGHKSLRMLEHYGKKRSQPKLAQAAVLGWSTKTERERENSRTSGKPGSKNG